MRLLLGLILAGGLATVALAQTDAEVAACRPDALRFCKAQTEARFFAIARTFNCMLEHRTQLSPKCSAVFAAHGF